MKDKKILFIFAFISLILILSLAFDSEDLQRFTGFFASDEGADDIRDEEGSEEEENQSNNENQRETNIEVERLDDSIYLKPDVNSINPITNINWFDESTLRFNFTFEEENTKNIIYDYNVDQKKLEAKFYLEGIIWDWQGANANGVIYSRDGFNGIFHMDKNGEEKKITEAQEWYNVSPDGSKIVFNGMPKEKDSKQGRYLYNVDEDEYEDADYIPDIDYVYSYIAATWSPDSIHIVSQIPQKHDTINIININKGIEKSINIEESKLSLPTWSEDGEKLAFLVQSDKYDGYIIDDLEINYFLSDKIGVYDTKSKEIDIIELDEELTTSGIYWSKDSESIILETSETKNLDDLLDEETSYINADIEHIDIKTKKREKLLDSGIDTSEDYPVHQITPIKLFENDIFLYTNNDNIKEINIMKVGDGKIVSKNIGYLYEYNEYKGNIYITSDEGIYSTSKNLNLKEIINFKSEYGENVLNVDSNISKNHEKIALYIQYDIDSEDDTFIEIKKLK